MARAFDIKNLSALILCGGEGTRLRPLTDNLPKPLIPLKKRPMIDYLVGALKKQGISSIFLAAGHKWEMLESHFRQHPPGIPIQVVNSGNVDIIQRIKDILPLIDGDFLIFYGDTLSDVPISQLVFEHKKSGLPITVTVWPLQSSFGVFDLDPFGKVLQFQEKPILDKWINIGHFYYSRSLDPILSKHLTFESFLMERANSGELHAFRHRGLHLTVNTQLELIEAEKNIDLIFPAEVFHERLLE